MPFTVRLINRTDQPLRLLRVNYSVCGCFFERTALPKEVPPRSSVTLSFGLHTEKLEGRFRERLTFVLASPQGRNYTPTMVLSGVVRREIEVTPKMLDFGTVMLGQDSKRTVTLKGMTVPPLIEQVKAPKEITVTGLVSDDPLVHQLQFTFQPHQRPGWRDGFIVIRLTSIAKCEVRLPFKAQVKGVVDTQPSLLNFGWVRVEQSPQMVVRVVNKANRPIRLRLVTKPSFLEVIPSHLKGIAPTFKVRLRLNEVNAHRQVLSGKLVFQTDLSLQPFLEVPFFAALE